MTRRWQSYTVSILILLIALGLRLLAMRGHSLWFDEAIEFGVADRPLAEVVTADQASTHDPPLYSLLLNGWMQLGHEDFSLRWLSVAFSVLTVAGTVTLGQLVFSKEAGWAAGLLAAVAPRSVYFGQEVNQYTLVSLLSVSCLLLLERYFHRPTRSRLVLFVSAGVLALLTHYELALYLAALAIVGTIKIAIGPEHQSRQSFIAWSGALSIIGAVGLALLIGYALPQKARLSDSFAPAQFATAPPLAGVVERGVTQSFDVLNFIFWGNEQQPAPSWLSFALIILGSITILINRRGRRFIAYLIASLLIGYITSGFGFLIFAGRYVWYAFTPAALLIAATTATTPYTPQRQSWSIGGLSVVVVLAVLLIARLPFLSSVPFQETEQMGDVVSVVEQQLRHDDAVYVYYGGRPTFSRYATASLRDISTIEKWARGKPVEEREANLWQAVSGHARVWLLMAHVYQDEGRALIDYLDSRCQRTETIDKIGAAGYLFECHAK